MVMVKPGLPYLDIIKKVKDNLNTGFGLSVREYSLIKNGINIRLIDEEAIIESLMCLKELVLQLLFPILFRNCKKIKI